MMVSNRFELEPETLMHVRFLHKLSLQQNDANDATIETNHHFIFHYVSASYTDTRDIGTIDSFTSQRHLNVRPSNKMESPSHSSNSGLPNMKNSVYMTVSPNPRSMGYMGQHLSVEVKSCRMVYTLWR